MDVMKRVREHYEFAKTLVPEDQIVGVFLYGSQNYGMDGPTSDVDTKCLVVPSFEDVAFNRRALNFEHHFENGEHINFVDVREFVHQILKQNPNTLELLFTEYYVLNQVFKGVWFDIWKHREEATRINPHKVVDTMRHMANKEYHHMKKNGFNHKKLATMFRLEKAIGDYTLGCKYKYVLQTDQAEFFLKVKRGNFVDSDEEGMRFVENCYEDINRLADRYIKHIPDVEDAEVKDKLMRGLTDLMCMHLGYEIEVRE